MVQKKKSDEQDVLEESDKYTVTYENMGHYGFQYMDGNTDFDILKVNITEETGND